MSKLPGITDTNYGKFKKLYIKFVSDWLGLLTPSYLDAWVEPL